MRSFLSCALVFGLLLYSATPSRAGPGAALRIGVHAAAISFEICRLEGDGATYPNRALDIPAGTEYDQDRGRNERLTPIAAREPRPLRLATSAAVSIAADRLCVAAPVRQLSGAGRVALGKWRSFSAKNPLNETYGYWAPAGE